jgi:transposase
MVSWLFMSQVKPTLVIPNDLAACQALIEQQAATIDELSQAKQRLEEEKEQMRLAMAELLQRAFGKRRERYVNNPHQLALDFGDSDDAADAACGLALALEEVEQTIPEHKRRRRGRRLLDEQLPEHIPTYQVDALVPDEVKICPTHGERTLIGYDLIKTLEFEPPKLRVRLTRIAKYVCAQDEGCGVSSPPRPPGLVEGNRYDPSVAAEIITGKYGYHLPIYRQQDYFAGSGWTPSRSTLLNLLEASARLIRPLVEHFRKLVLSSGLIGTDDTRVTLLLPQTIPRAVEGDAKSVRIHEVLSEAVAEGKPSVSARMWVYRSVTLPLNVFDFTVSRHRDGPDLFLDGFVGKLLADCYSGYQKIELRTEGDIQRGACVAHARRKVFEAREAYPLESSLLLSQFQQLYDIEDRAKGMSPGERQALRQQEAEVVWQAMRDWLDGEAAVGVLPKSKLSEALGYLRNHWEPLRLYLSDGRMPIDNNDVEQLMKQVALGRKNWLFVGSIAAGERAADFFTLVSSAVRNDLDVWAYVKDVLEKLLAGSKDYEGLRPDVWKESHPEAIRSYRVEERRDRADRKQRRRASRRQKST